MPIQTIAFACTGSPDHAALKAQLSAIPGVVEMNIDTKSSGVTVQYDDTLVSQRRIEVRLNRMDYRKEG